MKPTTLSIIILALLSNIIEAQKISDWQPENRSGVSSETGLLKSWPDGGPKMLWSNTDLSKGYSQPAFGANTKYITGNIGTDDILYTMSMDGKILWKTVMGRALTASDPEKFDLVSSFKVTPGDTGPFWAHPVIHKGNLYLRHSNALMAYDIKAN